MEFNEFFSCPECKSLTSVNWDSDIENCPVCGFEPSQKILNKRTRTYKSEKRHRICPYCYVAKSESVYCVSDIGEQQDCGHVFISIKEYELAAKLYELWMIKNNSQNLVHLLTAKLFSKNEKEIEAVKEIIEINEIHLKEWLVKWRKVEHNHHDSFYDF